MNTLSDSEQTDQQKSDNEGMSPWFPASEYRPMMVGPYQCKMTGAFASEDTDAKHMRWWDGEHWSYPLQPEHETADGWIKPADTYFIRDNAEEYNLRFAWRGFNEDQEPL